MRKKEQASAQSLSFSCNAIAYEWKDFAALDDTTKAELSEKYGIHPFTLAEIANDKDTRSHVQEFESYLFVSLHVLRQYDNTIVGRKIEVCLGKDWILTFHHDEEAVIDEIRKEIKSDYSLDCLTPAKVLYLLTRQVISSIYPIIDDLSERIDQLENTVVHNAKPELLEEVFLLKKQIIHARTILSPMRDAINVLTMMRPSFLDVDHAPYLRDNFEMIQRMNESFDSMRDLLSSVLDTYLSVVSFRANEVIKRLTIVATVFLPASFLAALGGINFTDFPFHNHLMFIIFISSIIALPIGLYIL